MEFCRRCRETDLLIGGRCARSQSRHKGKSAMVVASGAGCAQLGTTGLADFQQHPRLLPAFPAMDVDLVFVTADERKLLGIKQRFQLTYTLARLLPQSAWKYP